MLDSKYCNKLKIINDFNSCLKEAKGSISLRIETTHKTLNTVFIKLFASVITYKGSTCLAGNIIKISTKNLTPYTFKKNLNTHTKLSNRELEVLELICKGSSTLETSKILFLGQRTIETYRANLLEKTESKNIAELIMYAIRNRLIVID